MAAAAVVDNKSGFEFLPHRNPNIKLNDPVITSSIDALLYKSTSKKTRQPPERLIVFDIEFYTVLFEESVTIILRIETAPQ